MPHNAAHWRQQHERAIVDEFVALLSIPNIARDRDNIQRNAEAIAAMMEKRGIAPKLVSVPGGNPIVFGEIRTPGATRTIGFYAHYDGQPLDPKEWTSPPFEPTLRDKRGRRRRARDPAAASRARIRSRVAALRARRGRRQGADHRAADRARRDPRRRASRSSRTSSSRSKARKRPARRISKRRWRPTRTSSRRTSG